MGHQDGWEVELGLHHDSQVLRAGPGPLHSLVPGCSLGLLSCRPRQVTGGPSLCLHAGCVLLPVGLSTDQPWATASHTDETGGLPCLPQGALLAPVPPGHI